MMSSILPMRKMPENVQVTQESFYLPSRTTSKNKVLIWTYKKGHESAQKFDKSQKNAILRAYNVSKVIHTGR